MNEKERGILILHSPTDIDKSKVLQYVGERRVFDTFNPPPLIQLDKLRPEEADILGLTMEPNGQITVKQPVVFSGTRTVTLMTNLINGHLAIANEVCKSVRQLFKDKAFEGCRTPEPFRNDKGIYRQHKRQRKHK